MQASGGSIDLMVSAVIATRNRPDDTRRLMLSLSRLGTVLKEIVIVDASDIPFALEREQAGMASRVRTEVVLSAPSLSHQRNLGIQRAAEPFILLCDDDLEFPENYLEVLLTMMEEHPTVHVATGLCYERSPNGTWETSLPSAKLKNMMWSWFFQLGLWKSVERTVVSSGAQTLEGMFRHTFETYYQKVGNSLSKGGWPLVTQITSEPFTSEIFTLGGALFRTAWLKRNLFDEALDPHGIGDNYDVCLAVAREHPVTVVPRLAVRHYRSPAGRLAPIIVQQRRTYALHYFLHKHGKWNRTRAFWFAWSVFGQILYALMKGRFSSAWMTSKTLLRIVIGRNPLFATVRTTSSHRAE
ncbi:MAG: hypothetical protein A3H45_00980 [Ignavibacteria bacterium RIFCSPLOWO2_02_FULL_55_14]|nr:MAG: hypothetical protein A3H45_00980 [Ignavibacteria bacterium RIFCSPLOWO2_02_FULL_55_14]